MPRKARACLLLAVAVVAQFYMVVNSAVAAPAKSTANKYAAVRKYRRTSDASGTPAGHQYQGVRVHQKPAQVTPAKVFEKLLTTRTQRLFQSNPWAPASEVLSRADVEVLEADISLAAQVATKLPSCPVRWAFTLDVGGPRSRRIKIGPVHFLYRLYQSTSSQTARTALLNLLRNKRCGVDASYAPLPFVAQDELPLLAEVLRSSYRDTELIEALLSGPGAKGMLQPLRHDDGGSEGISFLHLISAGGLLPITVAKELLKVAAVLAETATTSLLTLEDAYVETANATGTSEIFSFGKESMRTTYKANVAASPTFAEIANKFDAAIHRCISEGETSAACRRDFFTKVRIPRSAAVRVGEEFFLSHLKMFCGRATRILSDVTLQAPESHRNILHVLVLHEWERGINEWVHLMRTKQIDATSVLQALVQREAFENCTPLGLALELHARTGRHGAVVQAVLNLMDESLRLSEESPKPADFVVGHANLLGKSLCTHLEQNPHSALPQFFGSVNLVAVCEVDSECVQDSLDPFTVELHALPSPDYLKMLLRQQKLVIIRRGAANFSAFATKGVQNWRPANLKQRFGDIEVRPDSCVGDILVLLSLCLC